MVTALAIGGIDPGGAAGVVADLKTFEAHGVWGTCVVTDVAGEPLPASLVAAQLRALALGADAVKVGPLASADGLPAFGAPVVARGVVVPGAAVLVASSAADRRGMEAEAARLGAPVVLVTGGHLPGGESPDLVWAAGSPLWLEGERLDRPTHGAGDVLASTIAAELARGMAAVDACVAAKRFVTRAIAAAGPAGVNPGWERDATRSA